MKNETLSTEIERIEYNLMIGIRKLCGQYLKWPLLFRQKKSPPYRRAQDKMNENETKLANLIILGERI